MRLTGHDNTWQAAVAEDLADWDERFKAKHGTPAEPSDGLWEQAAEALSLYTMSHEVGACYREAAAQ